jgi:TetR/AcrR family transcriptional repressor of mexJK operon
MNKPENSEKITRMGRPTSEESLLLDRLVIEKALELFLLHGYDGVSMVAVAKAAGISKRTLYARYEDKQALFLDALRGSMKAWVLGRAKAIDYAKETLESALLKAANALLEQALDPTAIKLGRITAAKAGMFKQEEPYQYDMSLSPRVVAVAEILEAFSDELEPKYLKNPAMTAELFVGLITGIPSRLASFGTLRDKRFEKQRVQLAVDLFAKSIRKPS